MKKSIVLLLISFTMFSDSIIAQPSLTKMKGKLVQLSSVSQTELDFSLLSSTQAGILFKENSTIAENQALQWLGNQLELRQDIDALSSNAVLTHSGNISVKKIQQYFKGIKVEHGIINISGKNGYVAMMQLEYYPISEKFDTKPVLNEREALQKAIDFTGAMKYEWGDYKDISAITNLPKGELVIIKNYETVDEVCLAYKFEIFALQPVSAAYVYVNAWNGKVILNDPLIKHLTGYRINDSSHITDGNGLKSQTALSYQHDLKALPNKITGTNIDSINLPGVNKPLAYNNLQGSAATRYNGIQFIYTDNQSGVLGKPYRLRETRNGMDIVTLNLAGMPWNSSVDQYPLAVDFTDNDNNWTDAEYNNTDWDNAALSVQFNMQIVSDYWHNVHNRKSWDNANSAISSYVHTTQLYETSPGSGSYYTGYLENAFWFKGRMSFGDGSGDIAVKPPYTPLDVSAHEMGHAITETTSGLVYQWESGALNEGFSDIWAACITDYAKSIYPLSGEDTWRIGEKCKNINTGRPGFRDMSNPPLFGDFPSLPHPSAYKNPNWRPASLQTCRVFSNTDYCGVHSNSGVLNKWFFLITQGQTGINSFGTAYNITGLGFAKTEKIAYLTSLNLTPNASYATARNVSLNATASLYSKTSVEYQTVRNAWIAVAVDSNIYNMSNTPVFTTNNFTGIAVGKNGTILAGTNYSGVYKYSGNTWERLAELTDIRTNDIKADHSGDFWIAQSGRSGQQSGGSSIAGGVNYFKSPFTTPSTLYTVGVQTEIPSRNARCMFVDTFRTNDGTNPKVWVATLAFITSSNSTSGMLGQGLYSTGKQFRPVNANINLTSGTVGCLTVGGNKTEIWTFVQANNGINQILVYDAVSNNFIQSFDHNSHQIIPSGFVARSIYLDAKNRAWIGLATGGIMVYDEQKVWHIINFPEVFPAGTQASFNAIAGTKEGDVYIGTSSGIVFFERGDGLIDKIDRLRNYKLFTKANGLPSNFINAIAYDTSRFKVLVATDSGIVFWEPLCIEPYCNLYKTKANEETESLMAGNWSNPAIWGNNKIPDSLTNVTLKHNVLVDINAACNLLNVIAPAAVTVKTGVKLTIYQEGPGIIMDADRRRR